MNWYITLPVSVRPEGKYSYLVDRNDKAIAMCARRDDGPMHELVRLLNMLPDLGAAVEMHEIDSRHLYTCPDCNNGNGTCTQWGNIHRKAEAKHAIAMDKIRGAG